MNMAQANPTKGKELSSEFVEEVSTMLEKLKVKIGKCEGHTNSPSLNFDSCEDFPPKNETEVLNLISKLQNTLDNITKPNDSSLSQLGDDNSLKNTDSKIDSSESRGETPTVLSEDYEANSEDSTDENDRKPTRSRNFNKEAGLVNKHILGFKKEQISSSLIGENVSTLEFNECNQEVSNTNDIRYNKEDARSMLSMAIVKCKSREEIVDKHLNSSDGQTSHLFDSDSDTEEVLSVTNKKKRELPWKIRAAKKRMGYLNKSQHSINEINNKQFTVSKSTGTINDSSVPVVRKLYSHSKSAGSIVNLLSNPLQCPLGPYPVRNKDEKPIKDLHVSQITDQIPGILSPPLLTHSDDSDSCDDEGEVFCVKPITANFLHQQEQLEHKDKNRLPFDVHTNEVIKITERFSKPIGMSEARLLDKAPRKKVYGPVKSNVKVNNNLSLSIKQNAKLSLPPTILSPKSDVPVIRGFINMEPNTNERSAEKKRNEILYPSIQSPTSQIMIDNIIQNDNKVFDNQLNRKKSSNKNVGYKISKSKSSPVCFKSSSYSEKVDWNNIDNSSHSQNTSLKPCFTNKKEKVKTNMVSDIQSMFEEQPIHIQKSNSKEILSKHEEQNIDFSKIQDICDDPSILLFTPEQLLKIAIHKAAINKQLSVDPDDKTSILNIASKVTESVPDKHLLLQHTLSLDSSNISNPISITSKQSISGFQNKTIISKENRSDRKKSVTENENDVFTSCPNSKVKCPKSIIKTQHEDIKSRSFSDATERTKEDNMTSKDEDVFLFNKINDICEIKSTLQHNTNTLPKFYTQAKKSDPYLETNVSQSPTINTIKNNMSLISITKPKEKNKCNENTFINNVTTFSKFIENKQNQEVRTPILKRKNSLGDAAQLLNNSVSQQRKKQEDQIKKRSYSATSYVDSSPFLKNGLDSFTIFNENKLPHQNVSDSQKEQITKNSIKETTGASQHETIDLNKLIKFSINSNNDAGGRSKSLSYFNNEDEKLNQNHSNVTSNSYRRQYSDQRDITQKTLGKSKIIENTIYNKNYSQNQSKNISFNPPKKETFQNENKKTASILSQNGAFQLASPPISSPVFSSPEMMDQSKRKPKYTDFIVPPLPTSAHKISQMESNCNQLSAKPSGTHSAGACSIDKDIRDSQESDKLNKVSDTWISAAKTPNIITSSKPWVKQNNTTIRGQYVKKNKDKLLQSNDKSLPILVDSNNIDRVCHKNIKDNKNIFAKHNKSENKTTKTNANIKLESKYQTHRIKDISTKFKMITDLSTNSVKEKKIESTDHTIESTKLRNKLNTEANGQSFADSQNVTKPKSDKKEGKNFITKICDSIFNDSNKTAKISNYFNKNSNSNKKQYIETIQAPTKAINNKTEFDITAQTSAASPKMSELTKKATIQNTNTGPTINKLSKTNEAFKHITKQIDDDMPNSKNSKLDKHIESRKSGTLKQYGMWENNTREVLDTKSTWKASLQSQSIVKKNKNKLENKNCILDNKRVERNCLSNEFKSTLLNFEQKPNKLNISKDVEKITNPYPLENIGIVRRDRTQLQAQTDKKDENFPLRLSKSCTFRHSSFEPLINNGTPGEDIHKISRPKPRDSHSIQFGKIVENLENGESKPLNDVSFSLKQKSNTRSRPKSLYCSSTAKKCSITNQFPWKKEVGKLPINKNSIAESKVISEDKRKKIESYFKTSQSIPTTFCEDKYSNLVPKEKVINRVKTRIKSNSSSERSSIYDSWEHLVSNTDYNSKMLDDLFSEVLLKDIELSDSSLSRRRFSDFSVDSNESISEFCAGSKLIRSQTISHILHRENNEKVVPINHATSSYTKVHDNNIKQSSKGHRPNDHEKARKTLLKLANFDGSSANKSGTHTNAYEGLVSQSSYVGMSLNSSIFNCKPKMESIISNIDANHISLSNDETSGNEFLSGEDESSSCTYDDCNDNFSTLSDDQLTEPKIVYTAKFHDANDSPPVINITDLEPGNKYLSPNICPVQKSFENSHHRLTVNKQSMLLDRPNPSRVKQSELVKKYFTCVKHNDIGF